MKQLNVSQKIIACPQKVAVEILAHVFVRMVGI